ncbi:MAG TPA: hypothetical protein VGP27_13780 [Mycobacterium sp.]|nr:hypothetical protein [Mycobacterium sp.]
MEYRARGRHVDRTWSDGNGSSTIEAVLFDHDAAALDSRLDLRPAGSATVTRGRWISDGRMRWVRWARWAPARTGWCAGAGPTTVPRRVSLPARW